MKYLFLLSILITGCAQYQPQGTIKSNKVIENKYSQADLDKAKLEAYERGVKHGSDRSCSKIDFDNKLVEYWCEGALEEKSNTAEDFTYEQYQAELKECLEATE